MQHRDPWCRVSPLYFLPIFNDNTLTSLISQKRWERLNKANGLPSSVSSGAGGSGDPTTPVKKEKAKAKPTPKAGGSAAKKRKIQQVVKDEAQGADEKTMKSRHHSDEDDAEAFIKDEA